MKLTAGSTATEAANSVFPDGHGAIRSSPSGARPRQHRPSKAASHASTFPSSPISDMENRTDFQAEHCVNPKKKVSWRRFLNAQRTNIYWWKSKHLHHLNIFFFRNTKKQNTSLAWPWKLVYFIQTINYTIKYANVLHAIFLVCIISVKKFNK